MESKAFIVLLVAVSWMKCVQSQFPVDKDFNCKTVASTGVNLTLLAGYWYEAARAPNTDAMKCLNVSVPATADKELELQLQYISNINGKVEIVKESVAFPWNNETADGIFNLQYNGPSMNMSVTYKLIYSDPKVMTILCGYSGVSPVPLFKLLSRERQLSKQIKDLINSQIIKAGYGDDIVWTEQSVDRCNAAVRPTMGFVAVFGLAIVWCLSRWH